MDADKVLNMVHGQAKDTTCQVRVFGATLTSWVVDGVENIFVSSKAKLDGTKAIRGGIPVCFPSFGPWSRGPQHGFARDAKNWKVVQMPEVDQQTGDAKAILSLSDDDRSRSMWDHGFNFFYTVTLTRRGLQLKVRIENTGRTDFDFTFALHTYFKVEDVTRCAITGLKGLKFIDKTRDGAVSVEDREIVNVQEFTDRVYKNSPDICCLKGLGGGRRLELAKTNISDTVVWNPWQENAAKMSDMDENEFRTMLCVEAVQHSKPIVLQPGNSYDATHNLAVMD